MFNTTTGYTYLYDQLNRLLNTRQHAFGAASGSYKGNWSQSNTGTTDNYAETFRYDANGNILQLNRNGNSQHPGGMAMDRLNYTYRDGTNQLWSVQDGIAAGAYAGDIDNQGGSNYSYDRIGNLIGDVSENISQVNWTVYGKIGNIQKKQAFLGYVYNAGGERVVKQYLPYATNQCLGCDENTGMVDLEVYERNSNTPNIYKASKTITFLSEYTDVRYNEYTAIIEAGLAQCTPQCAAQPALASSDADFYIRDATGNVLAVYHYDRKTSQLRWSEQHLYGSARLGMYLPEKSVISVSTESKQREVGYLGKQVFELSNHLGNILATITDKKLQVSLNTTSTAYFEADVQTVQDYYAFGMQMPGRKLSGGYRYGFNGHEKDNEVSGEGNHLAFGDYGYDTRSGRRWNIEPNIIKYPNSSSYLVFANNPIIFTDPNGLDWILSTGNKVYWYAGKYGDTKNLLYIFKASSGMDKAIKQTTMPDGKIKKEIVNTQQAKYQTYTDVGPTPEGKYKVNLAPDPNRVAEADKKTGQLERNPAGGIEKIPAFVENPNKPGYGWTYSDWGQNRARLESVNVTGATSDQRDLNSFYLHDSEKGYSHGCTEVETALFTKLKEYRNAGNTSIEVKVAYPDPEHKTNGGTKKEKTKKDE